MGFQLLAGAVSEVGPHRTGNEDAAFTALTAAAVADGVGGGPAGELASAALLHRIAASGLNVQSAQALRTLINLSNWDLGALTRRDPEVAGMATTFTGLFMSAGGMLLAHIGDSRAYRRRDGEVRRMSRDDSYVQHLVDAGLLDPAAADSHPRRNIVTATLQGGPEDVEAVAINEVDTRAGDRWLLCSDGVSDYLPADVIAEILGVDGSPESVAALLVRSSLAAGSRDNVTAVVCDVVLSGLVGPQARTGFRDMRFFGAADELFQDGLETA